MKERKIASQRVHVERIIGPKQNLHNSTAIYEQHRVSIGNTNSKGVFLLV